MTRASELRGAVYLDTSALIKLYVPEPESEDLEAALLGRRDLVVSSLAITEATSAIARRRREGVFSAADAARLHTTMVNHLSDGVFLGVELAPDIHRQAERLLLAVADVSLRAADALHLALAIAAEAQTLVSYDDRMRRAADSVGIIVFPEQIPVPT